MKFEHLLFFISLVSILLIIFFGKQYFIYDEPHYISNLVLISELGFGQEFIINMKGPAGPLYSYVFYLFNFIANDSVLFLRIFNIILGVFVIIITRAILNDLSARNDSFAFMLVAIPVTPLCFGMVLTEMIAMFFFTLSLFVLNRALFVLGNNKQVLYFIFSGFLMSIAISGRQMYLVCSLPMLFLLFNICKSNRFAPILFMTSSLVYPIYLFFLWGNLAPRIGESIVTQSFLAPHHFLYALGTSFIIVLLLAPKFIVKLNWILFISLITMLLLFVLIFRFYGLSYSPMNSVFMVILPDFLYNIYIYIVPSIISTFGIFFLFSLVYRTYENRNNIFFILCALMLLMLLFTNVRITHVFSTRYVYQAAPLFLIICSYYYERKIYNKVLLSVGSIVGAYGLYNYMF